MPDLPPTSSRSVHHLSHCSYPRISDSLSIFASVQLVLKALPSPSLSLPFHHFACIAFGTQREASGTVPFLYAFTRAAEDTLADVSPVHSLKLQDPSHDLLTHPPADHLIPSRCQKRPCRAILLQTQHEQHQDRKKKTLQQHHIPRASRITRTNLRSICPSQPQLAVGQCQRCAARMKEHVHILTRCQEHGRSIQFSSSASRSFSILYQA